jgi:hypothetical protein
MVVKPVQTTTKRLEVEHIKESMEAEKATFQLKTDFSGKNSAFRAEIFGFWFSSIIK